jgi:tetratricopeptide (TPR) repeat protein
LKLAPAGLEAPSWAEVVREGERLLAQGRAAQALSLYQRLYDEAAARDRATLLHYGLCLEAAGRLDEAVERYREAVVREPGFFEAHVNLAGVLWRAGQFERALAHARAAVDLAPEHPQCVRMLGSTLLQLSRLDEAERELRRALALAPTLASAQFDLAFCLLLAGRLEEGWAWYEKRWNDVARMPRPPFWRPELEWQGPAQPLAGRRLLVYAEQGLGDAIQFARYLPPLQALGAHVVCAVPAPLVPLLENSFPGIECLRAEGGVQADLHVALLDLPGRLGTGLSNIPASPRYLRAPADRVAPWRERLAPWKGKFKVGLAWSGMRRQVNNRNRAVALSQLAALFELPGVQCFSLQQADAGPYTDVRPTAQQLVDFTREWRDFGDSAAMVEQLDLVVSVDTATVHLAGALGTPTFALLPPNPDFRWLLDREDSPWYPAMRLLRRGFAEPRPVQVGRVLQAVRERLQAAGKVPAHLADPRP